MKNDRKKLYYALFLLGVITYTLTYTVMYIIRANNRLLNLLDFQAYLSSVEREPLDEAEETNKKDEEA